MADDKNNNEVERDAGALPKEVSSDFIPGKPYSKLRRDISEEDLQTPAVQRLLLNEIDKLEMKVGTLEEYEKKYHAIDKEKGVLEEKIKNLSSLEILYALSLSIGSVFLGLSSSFWDTHYGWSFILLGGVLAIVALISRYLKWH